MSTNTKKRARKDENASSTTKKAKVSVVQCDESLVQSVPVATCQWRQAAWGSAGEVLAIGSGDCSQLGLGADADVRERKKPTKLKHLQGHDVKAIAVGSLHNLVIVDAGRVMAWGCNDDHALGHELDEWFPAPVSGPLGDATSSASPVFAIACGASHSLALTAAGEVYAWGTYRDVNGVIGFSQTLEAAKEPHLLTHLSSHFHAKIVEIASGEHHDLALSSSGEVYSWGDINIGLRASDRMKKAKLVPTRVMFKRVGGESVGKIKHVYAGGSTNFVLNEQGKAWVWGPNNYNQAGLPNASKKETMIHTPRPVPNLPPLQKIACAVHHSLFLTRDGHVYSVGRGEDGRLGHGDGKNYEVPTLIAALTNLPNNDVIVDIACGECHSMAWTKNGRLYTWGYGDLLQLGNGVEEDVLAPYLVTAQQLDGCEDVSKAPLHGRFVLQASGGSQHSMILAAERKQPLAK